MPSPAELLAALERCHLAVTGDAVDLTAIPPECPFIGLDEHGIALDSVGLLELVVALEDELGCELDLAERDGARQQAAIHTARVRRRTAWLLPVGLPPAVLGTPGRAERD